MLRVYLSSTATPEGIWLAFSLGDRERQAAVNASYVPEATALRYPTLSRLNRELAEAADFIIAEGARQATEGAWMLTFDRLEDETCLCGGQAVPAGNPGGYALQPPGGG